MGLFSLFKKKDPPPASDSPSLDKGVNPPTIPLESVEPTQDQKWVVKELKGSSFARRSAVESLPPETARYRVFRMLLLLSAFAIGLYILYTGLLVFNPPESTTEVHDFGPTIITPLLTILASAAGYYFGRGEAERTS